MGFGYSLNMKYTRSEFSGPRTSIADKLPRKSREEIEAVRLKLENHASKLIRKDKRDQKRFLNKRRELTDKLQQQVSDIFGISGVYFLFKENECVYVGESKCVMSRISSHFKSGKNFDRFAYDIVKGKSKRKRMERLLIKKYRPLWNITYNRNSRV